jgi:hypothetical protein
MAARLLIDTDVLIDYLRGRAEAPETLTAIDSTVFRESI